MPSRKPQYRFQAQLVPTTPLQVLEMHWAKSDMPTPVEPEHGSWWKLTGMEEIFDEGGSMASLAGYMPRDGGDLLTYLKEVRLIVEAPAAGATDRLDDALERATRIRAIGPMRTYSHGPDFQLRPNETREDYFPKIFRKPNTLLDVVLAAVHGVSYKDLDKAEKARARAAGSGTLTETIGATLEDQARSLGWPLAVAHATKLGTKRWRGRDGSEGRAEDVAIGLARRDDERGSACEGDSVKTLMKAASFEVLARHNLFGDRVDAARRYFEAQCATLVDRRAEIIGEIRSSTPTDIANALEEILAVSDQGASKVPLSAAFIMDLYDILGADRLADIAEIFFKRPYDYRAGWPDLTLVSRFGVRFVEVKTTDLFHDSQIRFARDLAGPLSLVCSVLQVKAAK